MDNEPVEINKITDQTKKEMRDFDEQEAYFLLCEIFSYAQATHDYAKFQSDLNEWKKRYNIDLFSEELKQRIKYMLSKEFLEKVLKGFLAFDELSKKDPSKGLEQLRKVLHRAEKHKDENKLDKDLEELYKEYPLKFLKEKYPHVIAQLLSKSNRTKILEKFDSSLATKELENIVKNPADYNNADEFVTTIKEWEKLYPTKDFDDAHKTQVESTLKEVLDKSKLEELFPASTELDLSEGQVIQLPNEEPNEIKADMSLVSKEALYEFINIADRNINDTDSLFDWACKYKRYINSFNDEVKSTIVEKLMNRYGKELPTSQAYFYIPKMDNNNEISLAEFNSINDTKKMAVLQLLGILSSGRELTHEDRYNLDIINKNSQKAKMIEEANVDQQVEDFMKEIPENELTEFDNITAKEDLKAEIEYKDTVIELSNNIEGETIQIGHKEQENDEKEQEEPYAESEAKPEIQVIENSNEKEPEVQNEEVKEETQNVAEEKPSFRENLKVEGVELERVESANNTSTNNTTGATSSGGGGGVSISRDIPEINEKKIEENEEEDKEKEETIENNPVDSFNNNMVIENEQPKVEAVIIEAKPEIAKHDGEEQVEAVEIQTKIIEEDKPEIVKEEKIDLNDSFNEQPEIIDEPPTKADDMDATKEFKTIDDIQPIDEEDIEVDKEIDDNDEPPIEENTRKTIIQRLIGIFQREKDDDEIKEDNETKENESRNERERE